jgi:tricorn protease
MLRASRATFLGLAVLLCLGGVLPSLPARSAQAAEKYTRGLRYPSLTPDGKQVVFAYRGDIWVTDTDGKSPARRLTIHEAQDTLPRVSPDGTKIAFSSTRAGSYDLYVMPLTGGEPTRISFHSGIEIMCDWSPDGKRILFASNRDPTRYHIDLYEMPATGGAVHRITRDGGRDGTYSPDGKSVVYARGFNTIYQDNYKGSANYDLYTVPVAGGVPHRILKTRRNERYPFYAPDGKEIFYVAESKGVANFYAIPLAGGTPRQVTHFTGNDVQRPCMSTDHETVVYERWGQLYTSNLMKPDPKDHMLPLVVKGDRRHSGIEKRTVNAGAEQVDLSHDGTRMVFSLHGDIWISSANGGQATRLTSGPQHDEWPRFSPDETTVAFQSDRTGNSDIFLLDVHSGKIRQLTKNKADDFFHSWSPDGTRLVFSSERSGNRDIWSIDLASGETKQLTHDSAGDDDPCFAPDGRHVAFDSGREGNQAIYVMDADGGHVRRVTEGGGFLQVPRWSPDGSMIAYEAFNPASGGSGGIYVVASGGGQPMQVSRDGSTVCWSPRGDYLYFSVGPRGREEIYRVPAPKSVENREKISITGTVEVDVRKELGDLFDEAWRALGQGFYDPRMHGIDWNKMRAKYRNMAIDAENKDEFQNVIRQMLAELDASHLGIYGGSRPSNAVAAHQAPTGYLGLDLADGPGTDGGRKVAAVDPHGPADQAGLRVGDEVLAIQGHAVKAHTDLDRVLADTVGKEVRVRFRPITERGLGDPREAVVKPISERDLGRLRHELWVSGNAKRVATETKGHVGYVYLSAMDPSNLAKFQRAVANWNHRSRVKGMIIDIRENGGGNIHQQLMQILTAKPYARVSVRGSPIKITQPALYWDKPVVVLVNERSFSDAEVFPYVFQERKLGKIVGMTTPGGVIGTNDITLSDGTTFRIPRTRYQGLDGTDLEGLGVKPDYLVPTTPEDRLAGRDPQLAKAIEVVSQEIAARAAGAKPTPKKRTPAKTSKPTPTTPTPATPTPATPTPAKPTPRAQAGAMNPLADARPGEWVRYTAQLPGSAEKSVLKVRVASVEDGEVRFEREFEQGPPVPLPLPSAAPQEGLLAVLGTMGHVQQHETLTAEVHGKQVEVAVVTLEAFGGTLRLTFTNEVPCLGLLRVEIGHTTLLEATEWGMDQTANPSEEKPSQPATAAPKPPAAKTKAPAETPGADSGEDEAPLDPMYDAKVGEWIQLRSVIQGQETVATLRVVEVSDDTVTLSSSVAYGGKEIQGATLTRPRRERMQFRRGKVEIGHEVLEVKGHKLECITITHKMRRGGTDKRWICPEIPVNGLVRRERNGKVVMELLDWGQADSTPPGAQR